MLNRLIKILKNKNFELNQDLIDNFYNSSITKDAIYGISQIIFEANQIDHPTRVKCHEELVKISKQKKCNFSVAHNLSLSARVYSLLGFNDKAIRNDLEALKLWKTVKHEPLAINGQIISYANIGNVYNDLGLYNKAIGYFENGLKKLKLCNNDLIPYIRIHLGLGSVYNSLKRYKKAESFFIKAFNESKKTKNDLIIIPCEVNLIQTKMRYNDYESVIPKCKNILKRLNRLKDFHYKPHILSTLGLSYMYLKKYKQSEKYFLDHLKMYTKMKSTEHQALSFKQLGELYYKMKKFDKSLSFFQKSYEIYSRLESIQSHFEIIKYISMVHERKGDESKSLLYYKKYVKQIEKNNKEKDKLFKLNKRKIITGLESEIEQVKREKDILKKQANRNKNLNSQVSLSLLTLVNNDFLKKIIKDIESDSISKNKIIQTIKSNISSKINWIDYLKAFEQLNQNFIAELNKYKLSLTEIKICTFIKIGFDNHQIAGIMHVSLRAIQQNRYRIKKKLKINQKLDYFILSI